MLNLFGVELITDSLNSFSGGYETGLTRCETKVLKYSHMTYSTEKKNIHEPGMKPPRANLFWRRASCLHFIFSFFMVEKA